MKRRFLLLMVLNLLVPLGLLYLLFKVPEWSYFTYSRSTMLQAIVESDVLLHYVKSWIGPVNLVFYILFLGDNRKVNVPGKGFLVLTSTLLMIASFYSYLYIFFMLTMFILKGRIHTQ